MSAELMVNEIFESIEGEGKRAGELAFFIRLTGCNLRCSYCDTAYAFDEGKPMTITEIGHLVSSRTNITITGGEPLKQDLHELLNRLYYHQVSIETNGSLDIAEYLRYPQTFFTIDYKCPSSGMESLMLEKNFRQLRPQDVLKFVVSNYYDLKVAAAVCRKYHPICPVYISPVFGKIDPADIVNFMKTYSMEDWRLQLQLHKFIWNPEKRGV